MESRRTRRDAQSIAVFSRRGKEAKGKVSEGTHMVGPEQKSEHGGLGHKKVREKLGKGYPRGRSRV